MVFNWRRPFKEQDWSPDTIHKLDRKTIENIPLDVLLSLPLDRLRYLPPSTLARLPPDRLESAPPEVLSRLPGNILAQLSPPTLARLPIEDLRRLPPESLCQLPSEFLYRLPPAAFAKLPPETLGRLDCLPLDLVDILPLQAVYHLPRSLLAQLPPSSLRRLPPEILSDLPPITLAKLPRETLTGTSFAIPIRGATQGLKQHQPSRKQHEDDTGIAELAVPGELGRSKTVSHLVPSMHERSPKGAHDKGAPTPFSQIDTNARIAQKRASYRHLRHPSREETLYATTVPRSDTPNATQGPNLQALSPLEAVIAEAKDLRHGPEDRRSLTDGIRLSPSFSQPKQRSGPAPPPKRPLSPNMTVSASLQRHSSQASLPREESRVPSSESHKSVRRQRSSRQRPADDKPTQRAVEKAVDVAQRPVSLGPRTTPPRLSDGLGSSNKEPDPNPSQIPPNSEAQLEMSLRERDKVIMELQDNRQYYVAQLKEAKYDQQREKDEYEMQLAELRTELASEQTRRQHELNSQESSHQQRTKQLKLELLAQKSNCDKRLQEEREKFQTELSMARQDLDEVRRQYQAQLKGQQMDAENKRARQEQEAEERAAHHQAQLKGLQQEHKTSIDALAEQLATQVTAHEQQVAILTGQLEDQDADYRLQIAQLIEKHAHEIQEQKKDHQGELAAQSRKSSAKMESLGQQYKAQAQLQHDRYQQEMQDQADRHRNALQQQSLEHNRVLESLRAESGDYIRQASDDKLEGMFRQLKVAIEVVAEPFNLGVVVIQPGSSLDPRGILAREKGMQRHLLRSLVWSKIADGFFSAPFGFGVLGSGDGKQMLFALFMQWRKLVSAWQTGQDGLPQPPHASDASSLDLYDMWRDRENNRWRSATFQSMLAVVTARGEFNLPYHEIKPAIESPYFKNRTAVRDEVLGLLNEATKDRVEKEIEEKVDDVTCLAAELALEMGVHRAYLGLRFPTRGEKVAIGRDFVYCEDGDPAPALSEEVDLVVCPQFFKVGDGRSDLTTSKSIFRGEIYPIRRNEG